MMSRLQRKNVSSLQMNQMLRIQSKQFICVCHISQERRWRQVRELADASSEVDATDCAADGDPRELLQRQRSRVEMINQSPQVAIFGGPLALDVPVLRDHTHQVEILVEKGQVAPMQLVASEAECQKLIRNASAVFRTRFDQQNPNQPELSFNIIAFTKIPTLINDASVKEGESVAEQ